MARRFGPIRGAGVVVEELDGDKQIVPGALGWAGYAGLLRRGNPGDLIVCPTPASFKKKCGGIIDDSLLPDAAKDYYAIANGAGGIVLVRVTDGTEQPASMLLYPRTGGTTPMGIIQAKNGGRWGGARLRHSETLADESGLTETTLELVAAVQGDNVLVVDQWRGGWLELAGVPNKRYEIVGNDADGVITVAADATMLTDWEAGGGELEVYLTLDSGGEAISVSIGDGEDDPTGEFSLTVYVDGVLAKKFANLSTNPNSGHYWVEVINNDLGNDEIVVADTWDGAHTANTRPALVYREITALTGNVLTLDIVDFQVETGAGNPTFALGTTTDVHEEMKILIIMSSATAGAAYMMPIDSDDADDQVSIGAVTLGTPFASDNKTVPPFTITAGGTPLAATNRLAIRYRPLPPGELVGGLVYPRKNDDRRKSLRIVANDHKTISVRSGIDLTTAEYGPVTTGDFAMFEGALELAGGKDGNAGVTDAHYIAQAWDVDTSPFNMIEGRNLGLVKMATPGVTATAVQKAGVNYAWTHNHQYRIEIPATILDEESAETYVNDTIGRNDNAVVAFPSYGYIVDDTKDGLLKLVSCTGMIHGREARIASNYEGYHKAAAGIDATLPQLMKIPTLDKRLNEESLNPAGIQVIKKKKGNFVIWGDRTLSVDTTWRWKHQRELCSYYELVMMENFDFIVFAINDKDNDGVALVVLRAFFKPEWVKRALRGDTFEDAALIKVDAENNTDATRGAGDQIADISLRYADTVERFKIRVSKQGVFGSVG